MIWLFALAATLVNATTLEQALVRKIAAAVDARQLEKIEDQAEAIRAARLACRIQLSENRIPSACYTALKLEKDFGLVISAAAQTKLDRKCAAISRRLQVLVEADLGALSPSCRAAVGRAHELLAYKLEPDD